MKIRIKPHAKQLEIINTRNRFNVIRCGRRFGKSYLAFALALEKMLEVDGAMVLYTAPSYTELKGRQNEARQLFAPLGATFKDGEIKLGNSQLNLEGIWRADGLRGNKFHRVILDEWAHCPNAEDAWNFVISPMLADYEGDAYFFSTPKGKNHFHELDQNSNIYSDWQSFHYSTYEGGQIKESEIDRQKEQMPSIVFAQEFLLNTLTVPRLKLSGIGSSYQITNKSRLIILVSILRSHKKKLQIIRRSLQLARLHKVRL
jgi:hypothetical protein